MNRGVGREAWSRGRKGLILCLFSLLLQSPLLELFSELPASERLNVRCLDGVGIGRGAQRRCAPGERADTMNAFGKARPNP